MSAMTSSFHFKFRMDVAITIFKSFQILRNRICFCRKNFQDFLFFELSV